jgi:hypothetical protein
MGISPSRLRRRLIWDKQLAALGKLNINEPTVEGRLVPEKK